MARRLLFAPVLLALILFSKALAAPLSIGHFSNPKDFTLKITDPFPQENPDLIQPVVGRYAIKLLPQNMEDEGPHDRRYLCSGLYFKQVRGVIYIDVRKPAPQLSAGNYDLSVTLSLPMEGDFYSRQPRAVAYFDSSTDVILVLDNSDSMKKNDPRGLRFAAAENFLRLAALSSKINNLAMIRFSTSAKVILPWTRPASAKNLRDILDARKMGNGTDINQALTLAARLLEESTASEKVVILLTDGRNEPERYLDSHLQLKEAGARVVTIGLSEQADKELLGRIAEDTGGVFFKAVDDENLLRIYNQIASEISDFRLLAEGKTEKELRFLATSMDEILNLNLYGFPPGMQFELLDPGGTRTELKEITGTRPGSALLFRVLDPAAGEWRLVAKGKGFFSYNIHICSPMFLKLFPLEKRYLGGEFTHFAASLASLDVPMAGASVEGCVMDSRGQVVDGFSMYDDGVHGDNHAGDGVYGAIRPLDYRPGSYLLTAWASGKNPSGESFTRQDTKAFAVMAGEVNRDYFLASVLPLYLDLGKVEAGTVAAAHLRLAFEGRGKRRIEFYPADPIRATTSASAIPWSDVVLPDYSFLSPSIPAIYTVKFGIPAKTVPGDYSASLKILMENQEIVIPVNMSVTPAKVLRRKDDLQPEPSRTPEAVSLAELVPGRAEEAAVMTAPEPSPEAESRPSAPAPDSIGARDPEKPASAGENFSFEVRPREMRPFRILPGQSAEAVYTVVNLSSVPGTVTMAVENGEGELDRSSVGLGPREEASVTWRWEPEEMPKTGAVEISFSDGSARQLTELVWERGASILGLIFAMIILFFSSSAAYHGLRYLRSRENSDLSMSISSCCHIALMTWAFLHLLPRIEKKPERENFVQMEIVKAESMDYRNEIIPEADVKPVLEKEAETSPQKSEESMEKAPAKLLLPELAPKEMDREQKWKRPVVSVDYMVLDEVPVAQPQPSELEQKKERPETSIKKMEPHKAADAPRELSPQMATAGMDRDKAALPAKAEAAARELALAQQKRLIEKTERTWKDPAKALISEAAVISVNDRPGNRAVLKKAPASPREAADLTSRREGEDVKRENLVSYQGMDPGLAPVRVEDHGLKTPQKRYDLQKKALPEAKAMAPERTAGAGMEKEMVETKSAGKRIEAQAASASRVEAGMAPRVEAGQKEAASISPKGAALMPSQKPGMAEVERKPAVSLPAENEPRPATFSAPAGESRAAQMNKERVGELSAAVLPEEKRPEASRLSSEGPSSLALEAAPAPQRGESGTSAPTRELSETVKEQTFVRSSTPASRAPVAEGTAAWTPKAETGAAPIQPGAESDASAQSVETLESVALPSEPVDVAASPADVAPQAPEGTALQRSVIPIPTAIEAAERVNEPVPIPFHGPRPSAEPRRDASVQRNIRSLPTRMDGDSLKPAPIEIKD